jgi:hypothetical protein
MVMVRGGGEICIQWRRARGRLRGIVLLVGGVGCVSKDVGCLADGCWMEV